MNTQTQPMKNIFGFKTSNFVIVLLLFQLCFFLNVPAQKFTIPVLPDTQREINYNPAMFTNQMEWIASKKDSLNIPIALHVGDVVDFNNTLQYDRASDGFQILDHAGIPYAIAVGNHDTNSVGENSGNVAPGNANENLRTTERFNTYFPTQRFIAQKGRFEQNKSDNAFYTFDAGGFKWMVLTLEFCARPDAVNWANQAISKFPHHNVIILTHYHLTAIGEIAPTNSSFGDLSPQSIYDQLIKKHANIRLVLSGHTDSTAWRDDIGEKENHIYQILQDYQNVDNGGGYIRLLEIDPEAGTIAAKMYSPYYRKTKEDVSRFSFSGVEFVK
jgi:hypothetical protein